MLLLPALVLLTGCFKGEDGYCPPDVGGRGPGTENDYNVRLAFSLFDGEAFRNSVTNVDAVLFDGGGNYLRSEQITSEELAEYEGLTLELAPGDYRMVFWANVGGNTKYEVVGDEAYITYSNIGAFDMTGNGGKLFYAPYGVPSRVGEQPLNYYAFTVPASGELYNDQVQFINAYRSLDLFIRNPEGNPDDIYSVEITGLPAQLTFFGMNTTDKTVTSSITTTTVVNEEGEFQSASFAANPFTDMDGMDITIRNSGGEVIYEGPLADVIDESGENPGNIDIDLLFDFKDVGVVITVPGWESEDIDIDILKPNDQ
jgi:hypothetical protein